MLSKKESKKEKKWILKLTETEETQRAVSAISGELGIDPIVAKLLYTRGYTDPAVAAKFLYMENEMLCAPYTMKDMDRAVARIRTAVGNREKITVYGDYDVDGVTAVCTLYLYLRSIGAQVDYYIPNRIGEGYGVSAAAIDAIRGTGTTLIITVDTGITANEEVEYAATVGVDFVITDHHECRAELPNACAMINPHRPDCPYAFKDLAGVGVVFKLICAYEERRTGLSAAQIAGQILAQYADLVAIGTIADVMPIAGENRLIVSYGLRMIRKAGRVGLVALIDAATAHADQHPERKKKRPTITSGYVGFTLAPRINAAGRIRSATLAVELFLSENYEQAYEIARKLCEANKERQNEENKIVSEAYEMIERRGYGDMPIIVLDGDHWHHGVIGIVSSRITEKYYRPSILISFEGGAVGGEPSDEDVGKGSGRSIKGLNLMDALCACSEHLVKFGGHELAAGLSVRRGDLSTFREKINQYAAAVFSEVDLVPQIEADCEVAFSELSFGAVESIGILEPYGVGNPIPSFVMREVAVAEIMGVGEGKHTRMTFTDGKSTLSAMYFSVALSALPVSVGDFADILFQVDINEYMGRKSVQLILRDIRPSEKQRRKDRDEHERFEQIRAGASFSPEEGVLPSHDDFAAVYRLIAAVFRMGIHEISHKELLARLASFAAGSEIGYLKLKVIMKVFQEINILNLEEPQEEVYHFRVQYSAEKTDLEKSGFLHKLRSQQKGTQS